MYSRNLVTYQTDPLCVWERERRERGEHIFTHKKLLQSLLFTFCGKVMEEAEDGRSNLSVSLALVVSKGEMSFCLLFVVKMEF
jgi:hypothetical protein